jgi:hypothetical protein
MRRRFVMRGGRLVELDLEAPQPRAVAPMIISDIEPYRSIRTGEMITGRAQHREHLRQYGLEEVGNVLALFLEPRAPAYPEPGEIAAEVKRQLEREPGERRVEAEGVLRSSGYDGPAVDRILGGEKP